MELLGINDEVDYMRESEFLFVICFEENEGCYEIYFLLYYGVIKWD